MKKPRKNKILYLTLAVMLSAPLGFGLAYADPPDGKGNKDKKEHSKKDEHGAGQDAGHNAYDGGSGTSHHGDHKNLDVGISVIFGSHDRDLIRDYYHKHGKSCPPGLAKKHNGCLPPGQAKKRYEIGHRLPDDFPLYDIPPYLHDRLPGLPDGYGYRQLDGDIAIIELATRFVVDAVE